MEKLRRMKKKALALWMVLLVFLHMMALAGCSRSEIDEENMLTLLVKNSDAEKTYLQRVMDLYEEQSGIKVSPIIIDDVDFEEEAKRMFGEGDGPDLLLHFNNSALDNLDVSENFYYMNDEEWVDELTDGARAYCLDSEENVLGLPFWENSISGCYYNKKILDGLGLKPAVNQAEFDALCQALKSIGYTPLYWAANGCNWMFQFGLDPVFADDPSLLERLNINEITYADIPAVTDMIEWLDKAARQGWFNANYTDMAWEDIPPAMGNGEAAAVFVWDTWFSTDFEEGRYSAEDFALMPVFMGTADSGTYEGGNLNMLMVNRNSEKKKLALEFLSFCAEKENYNIAFDGVSTVSTFQGQTTNIQSDMVTDVIGSVQANERVSTAWPKIIGYNQDDVGDAVLKLFQGEVDVEGCVKLMDDYRIAAARELQAEGF